jgi:hypothetical protein
LLSPKSNLSSPRHSILRLDAKNGGRRHTSPVGVKDLGYMGNTRFEFSVPAEGFG